MAVTKVFLDTDVLINWLTKEVDPQTGASLWKAPYQILKRIEKGHLSGFTTLVNLMEIVFVLRRKKQWTEEKISNSISKLQGVPHVNVLVPADTDVISAYNLQNVFALGPFDAIYFAILRSTCDYLVSRDKAMIDAVTQAEPEKIAFTPEEFLKNVK